MNMRLMDTKIEETAVIGDQIFTDIWWEQINMFTILVVPLTREIFYVRVKRIAEKYILLKYKKFLLEQEK